MKPNHTDRNVSTSGVSATGEFQISLNHSAHIMKILRDQLYTDKKMAVLREYSANAWDANREVGKGDVPIKIVLPTAMDPTLYIRDYGPGISHEDMFAIYAQYGISTKRGNDSSVGMLGIGSKSGFAYTDSFTITTWQEGVQRIYAALLNNDEKGTLNLLDDSESDEETGTMIQIPVRTNDIPEFVKKAEQLFFHFKPRPDINVTLPPEPVPEVVMQHGTVSRGDGNWLAIMGCIAYEIDLDQLRGINAHQGGAGEFLSRLDGHLYFNIGEVEITASREGLEYSDKTKKILIDKFIALVDEFIKHTLDKIEEGDFSFWEKRCRAQVLNDLHLPIPAVLKLLIEDRITLGDHDKFTITYGPKQVAVSAIHVGTQARLIIRDEIRKIEGYGLSGFDYVIRPNKDMIPEPTVAEVKEQLLAVIEAAKLTGVPVVNISSIPWHSKAKFISAPKLSNKKHQVRTFVLKEDGRYSTPWSDSWNIEDRIPSPEDVFVILRGFKIIDEPSDTLTSTKFYHTYQKDREIFKKLKIPMPKIYGYKSTEKAPIHPDKTPGTPYPTWRVEFLKKAAENQKVKTTVEALEWVELVTRDSSGYRYQNTSSVSPQLLATIFKKLGKDHQICTMFRKIMMSKRLLKRIPEGTLTAIKNLRSNLRDETKSVETAPELFKEGIEKKYPLFEVIEDGIQTLLDDDHLDKWIDYIQLVDRAAKGTIDNVKIASTHSNGRSNHDSMEGETPRSEEGDAPLQQPEECLEQGEAGRELGQDRGPLVSDRDGESLVERQVRDHRDFGELRGEASA